MAFLFNVAARRKLKTRTRTQKAHPWRGFWGACVSVEFQYPLCETGAERELTPTLSVSLQSRGMLYSSLRPWWTAMSNSEIAGMSIAAVVNP